MKIVKIHNNKAVTNTMIIAEGSNNSHKSVIQLVRNYLSDLEEFGRVTFEMAPFETSGGIQNREIANLNEHHATLILTYMRNTKTIRKFKKKLVMAFFAMAEKIHSDPLKALNDPAAMRGLLLTYTEKVIALEEEVKEQAPKVAGFERIAGADGLTCITDTAKSLQIRPKELFTYMSGSRWIYKRAGGKGWIAYQDKIQQGLLHHKVTTISLSDGQEKISEQVLVTPKGLTKLSGVFQEATA